MSMCRARAVTTCTAQVARAGPVQQGSWWEAMNAWITARSGEPVPAKAIPPDHVVCDAPGTYVMTRYAD